MTCVTTAESVSHAIRSLTPETATVDGSRTAVSQTPTVAGISSYHARAQPNARYYASAGGSVRARTHAGLGGWSA